MFSNTVIMKKFLLGFIFGMLFIALPTSFAISSLFIDIPVGIWYEGAVQRLVEKNILQGFPDQTFRGVEPVDRAQLAVVIDRLISYLETGSVSVQPEVTVDKPVITYPADGSTVDGVTIKGMAKPNSEIWAYVNYPADEMACITSNSYASGGAAMVDENGNFEFALAEPCSKKLTVVVSTEDPDADKTGTCRSSENVSAHIMFTNSGELPGICFQ